MSCGSLGRGKKESDDYALTFFSLFLFSLDYPEGAGRLKREGREINPKEVHIVKRNNPGLTQNSKF